MIVGERVDKWDLRFIELARHISEWSKDPSTKCGAAIVDSERMIVSMGYNGFPMGVEDSPGRLDNREVKYELTLHAEVNAILASNRILDGCTLYVWPFFPCPRCAMQIIQKNIIRVVAPLCDESKQERWGEPLHRTKLYFKEVELAFTEVNMSNMRISDSYEPTYGLNDHG